jgi:flagella basal body P-ring formation protein FlgA
MKRRAPLSVRLAAAAFACLAALPARAEERGGTPLAGLRGEVTIEGETVTLGDLFDGLPADKSGLAVARAPAPGQRAVYDYRHLNTLAQR